MTYAQFFDKSLTLLSRTYIMLIMSSISVWVWLTEQLFSSTSSDRFDGLIFMFNLSFSSGFYAINGLVCVYCFHQSGFEFAKGYRRWFLSIAIQHPFSFCIERWACKVFGVLLLIIAALPLLHALIGPFVLLRFNTDILSWLRSTGSP